MDLADIGFAAATICCQQCFLQDIREDPAPFGDEIDTYRWCFAGKKAAQRFEILSAKEAGRRYIGNDPAGAGKAQRKIGKDAV